MRMTDLASAGAGEVRQKRRWKMSCATQLTLLDGVLDRGESSNDTLRVGDLVTLHWHVEIDPGIWRNQHHARQSWRREVCPHLIRTRLPARSTSLIDSLFERDMVGE